MYAWAEPAVGVALLGEITMWSKAPGVTVREANPVATRGPGYWTDTVVLPARVVVQTLALQVPPSIEKVTSGV